MKSADTITARRSKQPFVARISVYKTGTLAAFLIGLEFVFIVDPWALFEAQELRWPLVIFVGFMIAVLLLRDLFDDRAQVVIDDEGVFCRAWSDAVIPWSAILQHRFERELVGDKRRILIHLRDPAAYPPRSRLFGRKGYRAARRPEGFVIMATGLDRDVEDVMEAMGVFGPPGLGAPEERFW